MFQQSSGLIHVTLLLSVRRPVVHVCVNDLNASTPVLFKKTDLWASRRWWQRMEVGRTSASRKWTQGARSAGVTRKWKSKTDLLLRSERLWTREEWFDCCQGLRILYHWRCQSQDPVGSDREDLILLTATDGEWMKLTAHFDVINNNDPPTLQPVGVNVYDVLLRCY